MYLPITGVQPWNGSPVCCTSHVQDGVWFITVHCVLKPHEPGHGSTHFWFIHASAAGHSEFIEHSGRQFGGEPMYVGKHEHAKLSPLTRHSEFAPHGDGMHGFCGSLGCSGGGNGLKHRVNGSPVYPGEQLQIGLWLMTWHSINREI